MPGNDSELSFVDRLEALMPEMRAFARSLCRDGAMADDLVQEGCLKAWSSADSFDHAQPMRPWLFRIIRNEYYMQLRRSWRNVQVDDRFIETALVEDPAQEVSQDFARLQRIIADLPRIQRDALLLVVAAGMTYEEAAEVCKCSPGTVKSRVSRARDAVRKRFDSHERIARRRSGETLSGMAALLSQLDNIADIDQKAA